MKITSEVACCIAMTRHLMDPTVMEVVHVCLLLACPV
jgi:hypothetical protein